MKQEINKLVKRAILAYFKSLPADEILRELPRVHFVELHKLRFIQLTEDDQVVAVYRVENDGWLKRLKRFPVELGGTLKPSFYD